MPAPPRISFASVVHDPDAAARHLSPSLDALEEPVQALLLSNEENELSASLAFLYNVLLRVDGPPLRAFVHPDVSFAPNLVGRLTAGIEALGPSWGAIGIVGRAWEGDYVWGHELDAPRAVCTLDSCFVLTRRDLGLAFDAKRFDELHCCVEDYCLQCHARGYGVWVVPADATHASTTHTSRGSRWGTYPRYRKRLDKKWRGQFPNLTTV